MPRFFNYRKDEKKRVNFKTNNFLSQSSLSYIPALFSNLFPTEKITVFRIMVTILQIKVVIVDGGLSAR